MSFLEYMLLQEARVNPELAPKVAAIQDIKKATAEADLGWGNIHNLFVSFTAIEKLGINPKSRYSTPLAVYAYISDYVANMTSAKHVPFAGRSPHINMFKLKDTGKVLVLNTMNNAAFKHHVGSMRKVYVETQLKWAAQMKAANPHAFRQQSEEDEWKAIIDQFEEIVNKSSQNANVEGLGGRFWYISMVVAEKMADNKLSDKAKQGKGSNDEYWYKPDKSAHNQSDDFKIVSETPLMWNKLFRMIGIDACIDVGDGIIHGGEPSQVAVFNPSAIEMVDRIKNLDPSKSPLKNEGKIIKRMGELLLNADGEGLGKFIASAFKQNIQSGMIGNAATPWVIGQQYLAHAIKDVMYRLTDNNDHAYTNGIIKVEAVEAAMKSAEVIMRTNQKAGESLEYVLDDVIRKLTNEGAVNVYYFWPILVYFIKMVHAEEANWILKSILLDNETLSHYEDIMKVCKKYDCEWWNDPDYAEITEKFDKTFNINNDKEFYPFWWANRKGNV